MSSAWSQLEQLLTCAICLDRFRNPKLLPCQHTFCADPCMEGLQDYARRQIKCPECRAEHRIPYNGIQTFPTNVTLVRFLELHRGITGEEPEPPPSSMERCNVCSEKGYVAKCSHCDKKICDVCKEAHLDIMRREISRINNQVRRGLNRLNETLVQNAKNQDKLTHNCALVKEELDDLINRYIKDLQVVQEKLKSEIDSYLEQELKQLVRLTEDVDIELANISSNCDVVEKYVNDDAEWTDAELVEYKEIFGKSLDFLRNFDPDTSDFTRRVKLQIHTDPDALHRTLCNLGELKFSSPPALSMSMSTSTLNVPQHNAPAPGMNALMRSQSDHRLAVQFQKKQEGRSMLDVGQRYGGHLSDSERDPGADIGTSLYGRGRNQDSILRRYQDRSREQDAGDAGRRYDRSWRNTDEGGSHHSGFRSRYARELMEDDPDSSSFLTRNVRFEEPPLMPQARERIFDTDEAIRGPLSGVVKLSDCAKFMERIHENEMRRKQKEAEKERQEREPPPPAPAPVPPPRRPPSRQMSEDEVEKQKKAANQAAASTSSTAAPTPQPPASTPVDIRPSQVRRLVKDDQTSRTSSPDSPRTPSTPRQGSAESTPIPSRRSSTASEDTTAMDTGYRSRQRRANAEDSAPKTSTTTPTAANATSRSPRAPMVKAVSLDQDRRPTGTTTAEKKEENTSRGPSAAQPAAPQQSSFFNRSRQQPPPPQQAPQVGEEEGSSSEATSTEETTESEEEEEEDEEDEEEEDDEDDVTIEERTSTTRKPATATQPPAPQTRKPEDVETSSSVSALLNRSAQARRGSQDVRTSTPPGNRREGPSRQSQYARDKEEESRRLPDRYRSWRESPSASVDEAPSRYQSSYLANRRRPTLTEDDDDVFGSANSRFLSRSKSSALIGRDDDSSDDRRERRRSQQDLPSDRTPPSSAAAALRRSRLARSKSSNELLPGELESPEDTTPTSPPYRSRYGSEDAVSNALSRSRSSHAVKEASPDPERNGPGSSSTWAQYLRNKYGNRGGSTSVGGSRPPAAVARSRSSHSLYGRSGSDEDNSSEEDIGSRARRRSYGDGIGGSYGSPRAMYLQKKRMQFRIGTRGTEPGCFTWPRGVAVGPDSSIVVADSSNHRVQVFDSTGRFQHEFGTYGSAEGEFDCLAGVAVNRIGQFIVSDRYNHRIQVFDPSGRFLRSFGCEGRVDGRFNYPWGITTDSLGFIYVCDKENHRVQVFQSDGTFVGKFGTLGSRPGQLEHPHYVAVSNTNRVIVSDSNNHRIQIFDVNGRSLSSFGSEGSDDGHFKFPRGVAVDDQGYIIVGDSGNNRIQIFAPDGSFLRAFGSWGSGDGEFKGLEGIAVMPTGSIVVCDRENHRVQVF